MIRVSLLGVNQQLREGDESLLNQWREDHEGCLWLDIQHELSEDDKLLLQELGCHELAIQDVVRKRHPPKVEVFQQSTFILFRGIADIDEQLKLQPQQIGFFVSEKLLVTVHAGRSVSIDHYWQREDKADWLSDPMLLVSKIMHYASGRYLESILAFEAKLVDAEDSMQDQGSDLLMKELVLYRSQLRKLKRIFSYHEKLANQLLQLQIGKTQEQGIPVLEDGNREEILLHSLRDVYDRCERLNSLCAMYYEICGDLIDGYISITSHQLNNTMRILTVITAIFVPLSFMAGLYGMNFEYIPELKHPNGYFILLSAMASLAGGMVWWFKRKKWF